MNIFTNLYNYFLYSSVILVFNDVKEMWMTLGDSSISSISSSSSSNSSKCVLDIEVKLSEYCIVNASIKSQCPSEEIFLK
jgi:hypothetical protein